MKAARWRLDNAALEALLAALHRDRDQASEEYERLRRRLLRFFALHGVPSPEDLADEALNRLARKLTEGEKIRKIPRYLGGISRILLREEWHNKLREEQAAREGLPRKTAPYDDGDLEALEGCLEALSPDRRALCMERSRLKWPREPRWELPRQSRPGGELKCEWRWLRLWPAPWQLLPAQFI